MTKLKLGPLADDKPVKLALPAKLIVPSCASVIFAKAVSVAMNRSINQTHWSLTGYASRS